MSESRIWFMLDVLWLLALAAVSFGFLGWWWRGKLAVTMSLPEDLQEISELKERLLEYEIESKNDEMSEKPEPVPLSLKPSDREEALLQQVEELTAALAKVRTESQQAASQVATLQSLQADLATAQEALAAAEQGQAELSAEVESLKKRIVEQPSDPQGILSLDIPAPADAAMLAKKRSGKKK